MREKNPQRAKESKEEKLRNLQELAAEEAEVAWVTVGGYLDSLNKGEKADKQKFLASISSEKVEAKARSLCDFIDLLVSAREANNQTKKSQELAETTPGIETPGTHARLISPR